MKKKSINFIFIISLILIFNSCSKSEEIKYPPISTNDFIITTLPISDTITSATPPSENTETIKKDTLEETKNNVIESNEPEIKQEPKKEIIEENQKKTSVEESVSNITETEPIPSPEIIEPKISTETVKKEPEPIKEEVISKLISITVEGPNGTILPTTTLEIENGDTVFIVTEKILKEKNIPFSTRGSSKNKYVEGINNIYEFDYGPKSGYTYSVNGIFPSFSSSQYELKDGDIVVWSYKK